MSTKKEYKIDENPEIMEEFFFPKPINEGSNSPLGNNYNYINYQGSATNIGEKTKPKFNIEHTQNIINQDDVSGKVFSKTVNDVMNIQKSNTIDEENIMDPNIINNINKNHSPQKIKNSNLNELNLLTELIKIEENIIDLKNQSYSTDSLSHANNILDKLSKKYFERQNLDKQFKKIFETKYNNRNFNELNDSQKKIVAFNYILNKYFYIKLLKILKIPKYLKNKNINKAKFLENGVKKLIDECAQSLHNLIIKLTKKYVIMYKLNIKRQLKFGMKDFKLFFEKSVRNIYFNILPKKKPSIYKTDKEKGTNYIHDNIKKQISKAIEGEKKDENVKIKILNIIFSETSKISFWTFLEAFINDSNSITFFNEKGKEEKIILEEFRTLKDCLLLFKSDEKKEIKERIKKIKEGKVNTREPRKKSYSFKLTKK